MTRKKDPRSARLPAPRGELPAFTPVPRRKERHDGWTPERQSGFIEALADTGSVEAAARAVNMAERGVYDLRRQPGAESFRAAWEAALQLGVARIEDVVMDRALNGVEEPVYSYGKLVGTRRKYNDRLLMFILRNRAPERFAAGGGPKGLNAVSQMQLGQLKKQWIKEYEASKPYVSLAEVRASIDRKIATLQRELEPQREAQWARMSPETRDAWAHFVALRDRDLDALQADEKARSLVPTNRMTTIHPFGPNRAPPRLDGGPASTRPAVAKERPPREELPPVHQWQPKPKQLPPPPKTEWTLKDESFEP
jgi:hypothetical protein